MNVIWRAIKRVQIPATKESVNLTTETNKRPDGTTLLMWAKGKPLAWDFTILDTYAKSHIANKSLNVRQLTKQHNTRLLNMLV